MTGSSDALDRPLQGGMLFLAAIVLASANFIAVLDMTIANVSVPNIAGSLGISASQGTWVITSYSVAEAIVVPLTGWIAGRFGSVRVFTTAMLLFGAFSAFCGLAQSLEMLVFGRIMQGLTGGLLMPLSQTLLLRIFPKEKANAAMAIWAMTTLIAPVLGPILGGSLCDNFGWPLIFFINVPLAMFCAPVAFKMLRRYEQSPVRMPIDLIGLSLLILFVGALQLMVDLGKEHAWFESPLIVSLGVIAAVGFVVFVIWELNQRHPIVNLRVFRHRGFTMSVITLTLAFGAMFAANVLTPLWLQSYMGYTSAWAGMTTAWSGVLAVIAAPIVGQRMGKVDPRRLVFIGLIWLAGVTALRSNLTNDVTYWQISIPLLLMGAGLPFFFVPLTALSLGSVEPHETASAAGLQNFLRTLSGAVATSVVQTVWEDKASYNHAELSGVVDRWGAAVRAYEAQGMSHDQAIYALNNLVDGQSVMIATNQVMALVTAAFFLAAWVIWLAPKPKHAIDATQAGH
ncbi:MAG: DHA2 family efflux MFS transporter permease subunit [Alphaproteobacteria bacterium]|nr:DHA2 family efflux MFS transporter permease subunit [Alphaproteobacteria bacterium]